MSLLVASAAAFFLALARKWGVVEYMQVHAPNQFLDKMFRCEFCLSWWACVVLTIFVVMALQEPFMFFIPFFATMITRKLW